MKQSTNDPKVGMWWLMKLKELGGSFKQAVLEPKKKRHTPKDWPAPHVPNPQPAKGYMRTRNGNLVKVRGGRDV